MTTDRDDINDPVLAQLLREATGESPPAHVDAAILAKARRAVEPQQRVRSTPAPLWRWLLPLGAAATIAAIVISVRPLTPTSIDDASSADDARERQPEQRTLADRATEPASANALASSPAKVQEQPVHRNAPSSSAAATPERALPLQKQEGRKAAAAAAPASPPAPAVTRAPAADSSPAASAAAAAADASPREKAAMRIDAGDDAAAWIERIRKLVRESRFDEAAHELGRFRAAFADADARLPDDLRAFAAQSRAKRAAPR